jgi:mycofactocin system FadH/OYE family oxidoreductase 2
MSEAFPYLFTPCTVGNVTLKNRLVLLPHNSSFANDHLINERHIAYYTERAKGGFGLIIVERQSVSPDTEPLLNECHAFNPAIIPRYRQLTQSVHEHGARIFCQIGHGGRNMPHSKITRRPIVAPSPVKVSPVGEELHVLDREEIQGLVADFGRVAGHVKEGGFDGVEVIATHGYLIQQFLSPMTNLREDEYGGDLDGRMRFCMEVLERVREVVGRDFVMGLRLCGDEFMPAGLTQEDAQEIAERLHDTGLLDYLSVSAGSGQTPFMIVGDMSFPLGVHLYLAAGIKEVVGDLPVIAAHRIKDPVQAEKILADGQADLIGMARAAICDPELPRKAEEGRIDEIRFCIACNQNCIGNNMQGIPIGCIQNPAAGFERELGIGTVRSAPAPKKVMVIGGGPAGMEAARVAAERGLRVVLCEKQSELGGQINVLTRVEEHREFGDVTRYLAKELQRLGVEVRLNTRATPEAVAAEGPDAVIVATGSLPEIPAGIPGVDAGNAVHVRDVLLESVEVGQNVVIIDRDGSSRCLGTASYLADMDRHVEIVTPVFYVGWNVNFMSLLPAYMNILSKDVVFHPMCDVTAVQDHAVQAIQYFSFKDFSIEADTIVVSHAGMPDHGLYRDLKEAGAVRELYAIGDCVAARFTDSAIREGNEAGRRVCAV